MKLLINNINFVLVFSLGTDNIVGVEGHYVEFDIDIIRLISGHRMQLVLFKTQNRNLCSVVSKNILAKAIQCFLS